MPLLFCASLMSSCLIEDNNAACLLLPAFVIRSCDDSAGVARYSSAVAGVVAALYRFVPF